MSLADNFTIFIIALFFIKILINIFIPLRILLSKDKKNEVLLMSHIEIILLLFLILSYKTSSILQEEITLSAVILILIGFTIILLSYLPLAIMHFLINKREGSSE